MESKSKVVNKESKCSLRFESVKLESVYDILDGISWLDEPSMKDIAQFSGIDLGLQVKLLRIVFKLV